MTLKYVITGCAASGTAWASRLMTQLGSPCGHECLWSPDGVKVRRDQGCGRINEGESSWLVVPHLIAPHPNDATVIVHLIRNPLDVVRSLVQTWMMFDGFWSREYLRDHLPDAISDDPLRTALRYVARWDADVRADETLKIEHATPQRISYLFHALTGRKVHETKVRRVLAKLGTKVNSHHGERSTLSWDDIKAHPDGDAVIAKAQKWGYL